MVKLPLSSWGKKVTPLLRLPLVQFQLLGFYNHLFFFAAFAFRQKAVAGIPVLGREY